MEDDDLAKTMVIPNPGGRRNTQSPIAPGQGPSPVANPQNDVALELGADAIVLGENILLTQARDIIALAGNVLTLAPANSIQQLRMDVENLFRLFDQSLHQQGMSEEIALTARYLLCCLVDELVLSTPWGIDSPWSHQTLLGKYHNETSGGEKFFLIVNKIMEHPKQNLDLIEVCYVCISLGFRGKYRLSQTGENDIIQINNMLYQAIALHRPVGVELSPSWQPIPPAPLSIEKRFPPVLMFMLMSFVCIAFYIGFLSSLNGQASPVLAKVEQIAWDDLIAEATATPAQSISIDEVVNALQNALRPFIAARQIDVVRTDNLVTIRLISEALFPPGGVRVNQQELPDVNALTQAILPFSHSLIIVGHTDSTGLAESNWTISRQRAEAVENWLRLANPAIKQTITRGMADTQPLVNQRDASENRRVELILLLREDR